MPMDNNHICKTIDYAVVAVVYLFMFYVAWIGYLGTDDAVYILNARERIHDPLMIGSNHWTVRLTMTLPMALSFFMFGESEYSAALPTLIYTFLTGLMVFLFLVQRTGRLTAMIVVVLLASSPLFVVNATSLRIDAVETFYVIASLIFFLLAIEKQGNASMLFFSGLLAGLAFLTRPTTVALLAFYGLFFLAAYRMPRKRYLLIAVGFLFVWLSESMYYGLGTGDFFYRLKVDFNHDQVVRAGGLFEAVVLAPGKMLLASHNLGLAFWFMPLSVFMLERSNYVSPEIRMISRCLLVFSLTWIIVFSAFASKLVLDPRYLAPATAAALVLSGLWFGEMYKSGGREKQVLAFLFLFLSSHALSIHMENKDFQYAERWLVSLAKEYPELIYTDPQTSERARFLLEIEGLKSKVIAKPAPSGALFLAVPQNVERGKYNQFRWDPDDFAIGNWQSVENYDPGRKGIGMVLDMVGVQHWFAPAVWQKLNTPNPPITLYRRP